MSEALELTADDRFAIAELMLAYGRALDTKDPAAYAAVFAPDGVRLSGDGERVQHGRAEIQAESGDIFALYTDGLLETANAGGEEFGMERLVVELRRCCKQPLADVYRTVQESVARHGKQFDDQSLLLIRQA